MNKPIKSWMVYLWLFFISIGAIWTLILIGISFLSVGIYLALFLTGVIFVIVIPICCFQEQENKSISKALNEHFYPECE